MADPKNQIKSGIDTAADRAKEATDRASGVVDRVKDNARDVMDKAGDYASQARDKVADWAGQAGDAARHAGEKVQRWAGDAYDATSEPVSDFTEDVAAMIRKHPILAILIGFGCGLLLGRAARIV